MTDSYGWTGQDDGSQKPFRLPVRNEPPRNTQSLEEAMAEAGPDMRAMVENHMSARENSFGARARRILAYVIG